MAGSGASTVVVAAKVYGLAAIAAAVVDEFLVLLDGHCDDDSCWLWGGLALVGRVAAVMVLTRAEQ